MRVRLAAAFLMVLIIGCASQPLPSNPNSGPPIRTDRHAAFPATTARVTLPYLFTRHGVDIRVNSIEFADSRILVNMTLQETRGETFDFPVATLIQSLTTTGKVLSYFGYNLGGKTSNEPHIHLVGHEQLSIALLYELPSEVADTSQNSFELKFPTGKYWSSESME